MPDDTDGTNIGCLVGIVILLVSMAWLACLAAPGRFTRMLRFCWVEFRRSFDMVFNINPPDPPLPPPEFLESLPPVPEVNLSSVTLSDSSSDDTPPRIGSTSAIVHAPPSARPPIRTPRTAQEPALLPRIPDSETAITVAEPDAQEPPSRPETPSTTKVAKTPKKGTPKPMTPKAGTPKPETPKAGSSRAGTPKSASTTTPRRSARSTPSRTAQVTPSASLTSTGQPSPPSRRITRRMTTLTTPEPSKITVPAGDTVLTRRSSRRVAFAPDVPASPPTPKTTKRALRSRKRPESSESSESSSPERRPVRKTRQRKPKKS